MSTNEKSITTKPSIRKLLPHSKRYIITAAQNATPIHVPFWAALKKCAEYYRAELIVIPGRYKNPTSIWTQNNEDNEWWAPEVTPHLFAGRRNLNSRLMILGDAKVEWASGAPLAGFDSLTQDKSGIIGHGNRALRSVATPQHKHPKIMFTTGACTMPNYTDTKRGTIAKFNHCLGALIVELNGDIWHTRQLNACDDGSFIDLDTEFTAEGVHSAKPALSLVMGDLHHRFISPDVVKATWTAKNSIVNLLRPFHLIGHDVPDAHARNHHHRDDWITGYAKWKEGMECVRTEIEESVRFMINKTPPGCQFVVVSSNHDRAIARWLREVDFRKDPVNMEFYLEIAQAVLKTARRYSGGVTYEDPFILYAEKFAKGKIRFLRRGQSFVLAGVEHGLHGDLGPNGARGTTKNLSTIGVKVTKGHTHTAEIVNGCYSAGTSTGHLEYEDGPSSHSNAHVVQYANGKRAILFIIKGRYCLPRPRNK